jgi:superfamily II DNA/RNA helicase
MGEAGAWEVAVDAYMRHASDRRGVVFTPTVAAAHEVAALFAARGITAEAVDGAMPLDIRHGILGRVHSGETQVVANAMVLTEGYDNPAISCVVIARPTVSEGLYVQMAGRGLRPALGKTDCLILDIVGGSDGKSLATLADLTGHDVTEVEEGESLVEAKQRHKEAGEQLSSNTAAPYLGSLTEQEINLFSSSGVAWTTWQEQVRYINVTSTADSGWSGNLTLYIAPGQRAGTYAAIWRHRETGIETPIADGVSLPLAMRKAEKLAREWGGALVSRKWKPKPATDGQHRMAARFGIVLPSGATTRDASTLIDRAKVDPVIDRDFTRNPPRGYIPHVTT